MRKKTMSIGALVAGVAIALGAPLAASAHVTVGPDQAAAGSFALIDFKVPTESATAVTNKLVLTIPQDTPFAYVNNVPVPGWTVQLTTETLATPIKGDDGEVTQAVTSVTWTADPGTGISAEQLGVFPLSVGPVPDTGRIVLAVDQGYSDGTVVSWSETGEGAEHPAPVLYVNDAPAAEHSHDGAGVEATETSAPAAASGDVLARVLGVGGLVVGVIGLVVALVSRRRTAE
jgi:uncharacterized protein YcnI